jgi:hypothetical protein
MTYDSSTHGAGAMTWSYGSFNEVIVELGRNRRML